MTKAIAKKENTEVGTYDFGDMAGVGYEGVTSDELSIPFIGVLQSNSPQVVDEEPAASKPGMLYNTVTQELYASGEGVVLLPVHWEKAHVEWIPRDSGGGFVGTHDCNSDVVKEAIRANDGKRFGKLKIGDNDLIETKYIYALVLDPETMTANGFAVVSFTSTKMKPFNDYITGTSQLRGKPPMFAQPITIKTVKQKNEHGTFFNFKVGPLGDTWRSNVLNPAEYGELMNEAVEFRKMVLNGVARADYDSERATGSEPSTDGGDGEDAPF